VRALYDLVRRLALYGVTSHTSLAPSTRSKAMPPLSQVAALKHHSPLLVELRHTQ